MKQKISVIGYTEEFDINELTKGSIIRRVPVHPEEYFEVGDFHPEVRGWELRPNGRNTLDGTDFYSLSDKKALKVDLNY